MFMPLFSIITVTLNPPPGDLRRTIESVVGQEFGDWELLVKDGGSADNVREALPNDPRIRLVVEPDTGIFDAMNQGLREASGDLICLLNAGDSFFDQEVLATVAQACKRSPGVEFFYGDVAKPGSRSGFELYPEQLSRRFLFSRGICHQAWFVRREAYARVGDYETDFVSGGDPRYLLRMLLVHRVSHRGLGRPVVTYKGEGVSRIPENSMRSRAWVTALKAELFTPSERIFYGCGTLVKCVAKRLFYDPFAWRLVRMVRARKHSSEAGRSLTRRR